MANPVAAARAKIAALRAEIIELERFLAMYEKLSAVPYEEKPRLGSAKDETAASCGSVGNETPLPVDKSVADRDSYTQPRESRRRAAGAPKPAEIATLMERIIRDVGRPMTRGEIVSALEARDMMIPYEDKPRYVGTIAWRHKGLFENIEGRGYWLRGEPVPTPSIDDAPPVWRRDPSDEIPEFDPHDPKPGLFG